MVLGSIPRTETRGKGKKVKGHFYLHFFFYFGNVFADKMFLYILTYHLLSFIKQIKIFTEKAKCDFSPLI